MNQEKTSKFIAECRKNKKMTHENYKSMSETALRMYIREKNSKELIIKRTIKGAITGILVYIIVHLILNI